MVEVQLDRFTRETLTQAGGLNEDVQNVVEWQRLHLDVWVDWRDERGGLLEVHPQLLIGLLVEQQRITREEQRIGRQVKVPGDTGAVRGQVTEVRGYHGNITAFRCRGERRLNCSQVGETSVYRPGIAASIKFLDFDLDGWTAGGVLQEVQDPQKELMLGTTLVTPSEAQ